MHTATLSGRRSCWHLRRMIVAIGAAACTLAATPALAQEAINTESATQPGVGTLYLKPQFRLWRYGVSRDPASSVQGVTRAESSVILQYGLAKDWSLSLKVPAVVQEQTFPASRNLAASIGQIEALFKFRVYRSDTAALDTVRAVVYGGAMLPNPSIPSSAPASCSSAAAGVSPNRSATPSPPARIHGNGSPRASPVRPTTSATTLLSCTASSPPSSQPRTPPAPGTPRSNSTASTKPAATTKSCSRPDCSTKPKASPRSSASASPSSKTSVIVPPRSFR